jgi:16S rRNA (cytidine1402-2'-O)-methyltransferase
MSGLQNAGVLYVVATPIGHLGDLSRRAEDVLRQVQIVAAEDTRRTRVLLEHIDHRAPELVSLHEHNEEVMVERLLARLQGGADVALVSDAGTPLVNDPGFLLVQAARAGGVPTVPIPGPCAITTALSVCPIPCHPFRYVGFLPAKAGQRQQRLAECLNSGDAVVFLESPHRILETLAELSGLTNRRLMLARELTKQYETLYVGSADALIEQLGDKPKGEFTCIIEAGEAQAVSHDQQLVLQALLQELPPTKAAKLAATICNAKKSDMYGLAVSLSGKAG